MSTVGLKIANDYLGADLGLKIAAASLDLGGPGIIVIEIGDAVIATPFALAAGQRLAFNDGTITTTHDGNFPTITLNAGCSVAGIGTKWGTKITEPLEGTSGFSCVIADVSSGLAGGPNDNQGPAQPDTPSTKNANGGVIAHNRILGGVTDQSLAPVLAGGISVTLATDVLVCDNYIRYCGQTGIGFDASDNCTMDNNDVADCGPIGVIPQTLTLLASRWCTVSNNNLSTQLGSNYYAGIQELPDADFGQTCDFNEVYGNRLYFSPEQSIADPLHELRISMSGPNSREWDNRIGGQTFGGPAGVDTLAALAAGYIPGLRTGSVPAVALVLGQATRSDVQPLLYAYDPASAATPDGITTVKTTNNVGNGNYILSSQWLHLTSTERDALTGQRAGFTFFNDTTGKLQTWGGDSAWHDLW